MLAMGLFVDRMGSDMGPDKLDDGSQYLCSFVNLDEATKKHAPDEVIA